jgi:hypothetical protein
MEGARILDGDDRPSQFSECLGEYRGTGEAAEDDDLVGMAKHCPRSAQVRGERDWSSRTPRGSPCRKVVRRLVHCAADGRPRSRGNDARAGSPGRKSAQPRWGRGLGDRNRRRAQSRRAPAPGSATKMPSATSRRTPRRQLPAPNLARRPTPVPRAGACRGRRRNGVRRAACRPVWRPLPPVGTPGASSKVVCLHAPGGLVDQSTTSVP